MYSVFSLDTFIPLFSMASLHCPSSNSDTSFSLAHSATPHLQGASFLMFSVSESIMMANRKGLKWVLGEGQLLLQKFAFFYSTPLYGFALMVHALHQSDVLLWHPLSHTNTVLPSELCRMLSLDQ